MMLAVGATQGDWWSRHGAHVLLLAGPAMLIALVAFWSDLRAHVNRRSAPAVARKRPNVPVMLAAACSLGAAAVHLRVCPEHFEEATLYGVFFAVAAGCQAGWAVLAWRRPQQWLVAAAVAGNTAIVALWAVTRTVGIPLGAQRGSVEAIGALDVVATALEVGLVVCALWALVAMRRTSARFRSRARMAVVEI